MNSRKYLGKRTQWEQSDKYSGEESDTEESLYRADKSKTFMTCPVSNKLFAQQKKKCYKKKLSYKKVWEKVYPWVQCEDPKVAMFCSLCKKWGRPPPSANGGWTTRGIIDWNHATELLKQHSRCEWHHDSSITVKMARHVEQQNVFEIQCAGAARHAEEQRKKNREIILKLMRSIYFLAVNRIPHSTTYKDLIELQVFMAMNC